jgi:protein-tyrosine phosphatase
MGNICRSPIAEGVLRGLVEDQGLSGEIEIDSCGTGSFHIGNPPDKRSIEACIKRDIDISGLRARKINQDDFRNFDYIIAMDEDNMYSLLAECPSFEHEENIHLFLDLAPYMGTREIPDPYYGSDLEFENVLNLTERAAKALLGRIKENDLT